MTTLTKTKFKTPDYLHLARSLPPEALAEVLKTLYWYARPGNADLEDDGYIPVQGSSSICEDNGERARVVLRQLGLR